MLEIFQISMDHFGTIAHVEDLVKINIFNMTTAMTSLIAWPGVILNLISLVQ